MPMDLGRPARSLALLCLCATVAPAATGVALIHGKGGADLKNQATANAYWTTDMINAVTRNNKVPVLVCHYDGTLVMWDAADQVAAQLVAFIQAKNITDLVLDTHSFGGVVTRWMLSNPSYNPNYQKVLNVTRWVNTVAAPQAGSEAANLAGHLSGSWFTGWITTLLGEKNPSTVNCQTDAMAYYNKYWLKGTSGRPALPRTFYTIAGTGTINDWKHAEDYELSALSGVSGFPGANDGMVGQYSAQAVGVVWFTTPANHHHNRRNDYQPIGTRLSADF